MKGQEAKGQDQAPGAEPERAAHGAPPGPATGATPAGIPEEAEGTPRFGSSGRDYDLGVPVGPTPAMDFWKALYGRRSVRRFKPDPVPRELVDQVMHAGIWAPSSCNYQMWDLVAVDHPEINRRLAALSSQMGNAPVNIVVSYGRDFSEEGFANIQSASALIQNMSLAAHVLGLGTFWITQMGNAEKVREIVGLPYDRLVVAVLALGFPKSPSKSPQKRRPLSVVSHYNHYAGRAIPSSADPADWPKDLLAAYQRARVLNGLRHNKPRPWEVEGLGQALQRLVPEGREPRSDASAPSLWLDVLPCTGIVTERLSRERKGFRFEVAERTRDVAEWVAARTIPPAAVRGWPDASAELPAPQQGAYDVVSCWFRLEDLAPPDRSGLVADMARWVKPDGKVLIGFVSKRSYHVWSERLRRRRGGPRGVEYVLSPDPNIGPFEALAPAEVLQLARSAGLKLAGRLGVQAAPPKAEIEFRARNFSARSRLVARWVGGFLGLVERLPGARTRFGRFQFLALTPRPKDSPVRGAS